jgi:hypothetical protein
MLKALAMALSIIAVQANAVCGTQIVSAKTAEDARQRAAASLAIAINSKLSFLSKSEETIFGVNTMLIMPKRKRNTILSLCRRRLGVFT